MVFFLFLLLVVISFGYLAIYTNEYLLLLNNVDIVLKIFFLGKSSQGLPANAFHMYKVGHGGPIIAKLEFSIENSNRDKNYRT